MEAVEKLLGRGEGVAMSEVVVVVVVFGVDRGLVWLGDVGGVWR